MLERTNYDERGYKPFLFYAVFGVDEKHMKISKKRHHVEKIPEKLDISFYAKSQPEQKAFVESFYSENLGAFLAEKGGALSEATTAADNCVVLRGEIEEGTTFGYLVSAIGIIQALCENGAVSVLDVQTLTWYSTKEWEEIFFEKELNVYRHIGLFISKEQEGEWLHTRGMAKFGRPDVSIVHIPQGEAGRMKPLMDQLIYYAAQGAWFCRPVKVNTQDEKFLINPHYVEDFENCDFNNAYIELDYNEITTEPKS